MDASPTHEASNGRASIKPTRHEIFYFEDRTVIFRVQDVLFGVHKSIFLRHSPVFRQMWALPSPSDHEGEGSTDEHPIILQGTTAHDFACLLSVIYPTEFGVPAFTSLQDWRTVLTTATQFDFEGVRNLAINAISNIPGLSPVQKISLSREYGIKPEWIVQSLSYLVYRRDPITEEEAQILGIKMLVSLARAREKIAKRDARDSAVHQLYCDPCRPVGSFNVACVDCDADLDVFVDDHNHPAPMLFILEEFGLTADGQPVPATT